MGTSLCRDEEVDPFKKPLRNSKSGATPNDQLIEEAKPKDGQAGTDYDTTADNDQSIVPNEATALVNSTTEAKPSSIPSDAEKPKTETEEPVKSDEPVKKGPWDDYKILNEEKPEEEEQSKSSLQISRDLNKAILMMQGTHIDDSGKVNYENCRTSEEYKEYCKSTAALQLIDMAEIEQNELTALCINLYNCLMIHGILALGEATAENRGKFFNTTAYLIGDYAYSLDDIEHGILRGNKPHPSGKVFFAEDDPRAKYALKELDPRVHFALVCGAKSCPPVRNYSEKNLERGLNAAATNFLEDGITVNMDQKVIKMSKILSWYGKDFGEDDRAKLEVLKQWLDEEKKEQLESLIAEDNYTVEYEDYDWSLNHS